MNTLDIICDACDAQMRLSPALLSRIAGKTGRVTCKQCQGRVILDGRGEAVSILSGATIVEALELEEVSSSSASSGDDIRFSEAPARFEARQETRSSLPPPLPRAAQMQSFTHAEPGLLQLADQIRTAVDREPVFEAPPPMRAQEDSLSPHSIDDDEEGLVHLGREFRSSPFSSERDSTYQSLYPQNTRSADLKAPLAPAPLLSKAALPPRARKPRQVEPSPLDSDLSVGASGGAGSVILGPDGTLLNDADLKPAASVTRVPSRNSAAPWLIAAVSLLALGVSVGIHFRSGESFALSAAKGPAPKAAALAPTIPQAAAPDADSDVPVVEADAPVVEAAAPPAEQVESQIEAADDAKSSKEKAPSEGDGQESSSLTAAPASEPAVEVDAEGSDASAEEAAPAELPPFSAGSASAALRDATALASGCRLPNDPEGTATVLVTFAPSGRVTQAAVSGEPFAGTTTGGCIASRFREARVPAFSGDFVTVKKTVTIK